VSPDVVRHLWVLAINTAIKFAIYGHDNAAEMGHYRGVTLFPRTLR
jgi:acyl-CoA hydrolase